jgi:hypothetical protein
VNDEGWSVRTALHCPGCGKRCGSAQRLAADADVIHVTTFTGKRPGSLPGMPVHGTRGRTLRLSDPDGWPLTWRCVECWTTVVHLERHKAARAVGVMTRLGLGSMPG